MRRVVGIGLIVALWPASAVAQHRPRARVALVVAADAPQDWGWEVRAALRRTRRFDPRAVEARPAAPVPDDTEEAVQAAVADAERLFRLADFTTCVDHATLEERRLAPLLAQAGALRRLAGLIAFAAACELKRGATAVALERANLALAVDPELVLDPARHPPDVAELFESARQARSSAVPVEIELVANVPEARFEIDGRDVPARSAVAPGTHWILTRAMGARTEVRAVAVTGAGPLPVTLAPIDAAGARAQLARPPRSADLGPDIARAAGIATDARYTCTVQVRGGRVGIALWQVVGLRVSELGRIEASAPRDAAGWSALLGRVHTSLRPRALRPRGGGVPVWVWIAGAATVVAAGTALTLALWPDEPEQRIRLVPGGACFDEAEGCCQWPDC